MLNKLSLLFRSFARPKGTNFTERGKGFNFAIRVTLVDKESLANYGPHPAHLKVKDELLVPIIEDILAIDYEY